MKPLITFILVWLQVVWPLTAGLKTYTVGTSGDYPATTTGLQDALNAAAAWQGTSSGCDTVLIKVQPGDYSIPGEFGGAVSLPGKSRTNDTSTGLPLPESQICRQWVVVRSTGTLPAPGVRFDPAVHSGQTVRLVPALGTRQEQLLGSSAGNNTGYWRFEGFELTSTAGATETPSQKKISNMIALGPVTTNCHLADHHIVFDRSYIHGLPDEYGPIRGIYSYCSNDISVINSDLREFHDIGSDSQTVGVFGGKNLKIVNNYLDALGEVFLSGGGGINGQSHPRLTTFLGNTLMKQIRYKLTRQAGVDASGTCAWEGGFHYNTTTQQTWECQSGNWVSVAGPGVAGTRKNYIVKNHFESKALMGAYIIGNYMANGWNDDQVHNFFLSNQTNQSNHANGRFVRSDHLYLEFNKMHNGHALVTTTVPLSTNDYIQKMRHMYIRHNLVTDMAASDPYGTAGATERGQLVSIGTEEGWKVIEHNTGTMIAGRAAVTSIRFNVFEDQTSQFSPTGYQAGLGPFYIRNNLWPLGTYGINVFVAAGGVGGLQRVCGGLTGSGYYGAHHFAMQMDNNVMTKETTTVQVTSSNPCGALYRWPNTNTFQAAQTASPASWQEYLNTDFTAKPGSAVYRTATDGSDVGADIARVNWYTETAQTGTVNNYLLGFEVFTTRATLNYNALSTSACTVDVDNSAAFTSPEFSTTDAGGKQSRAITKASMGLSPGFYYARVTCDGKYKVVDLLVI